MTPDEQATHLELQEAHRLLILERYEALPPTSLPTRENTILTYPTGDNRLDKETHKGMMESFGFYGAELEAGGYSDVGLARNLLFNGMLRTPFEWMICVDSDIGFRRNDMHRLMEWKGPKDYAVHGVYAKKDDSGAAVTQGLGFARIHRSVLEAIKSHIPFTFVREGIEMQDFCITGTSAAGYLREDTGFWFLCSQVGVRARLIWDLNLKHYGGRRAYEVSELQKRNT